MRGGQQIAKYESFAYPIEAVLVFAGVGKADILEGQDGWWQLVTVWELEVEGALMLHWGSQTSIFHLVQNLLFTLRLLHQIGVCSCSAGQAIVDVSAHSVTLQAASVTVLSIYSDTGVYARNVGSACSGCVDLQIDKQDPLQV